MRHPFMAVCLLLLTASTNAQLLKKIKQTAKDAQDAAVQVAVTAKTVTGTVIAVKELQHTWHKDTSKNIRYVQVPDYRNREEVNINKKQKLSVENGEFKNLTWSPLTKFDNQIFPSFIIGWADYKGEKDEDMGSSLGFTINTSLQNIVLKWEIECSEKDLFNIDSGYINCDALKNTNGHFLPKIDWNYKTLCKHQSNTPVNVYFRLTDPNSGGKVEKLVNINLRSINDCLFAYNSTNLRFMFASYVNEDNPDIDKILKAMLDTKMIDAILGYQAGPDYLDLEVAALWRVLHEKGFQYSSITDNSGYTEGSGVLSQTVRTFDKSLKTSQANCVDGTVLFASILKKIGIRPVLMTVPGHCFLGYYTDDTTTNIRYLETTLMSSTTYIQNPKATVTKYADLLKKMLPKGTKLSELNKAYYLQFLDARLAGKDAYQTKLEKYGPKSINPIDITVYRKYIKPIPIYED